MTLATCGNSAILHPPARVVSCYSLHHGSAVSASSIHDLRNCCEVVFTAAKVSTQGFYPRFLPKVSTQGFYQKGVIVFFTVFSFWDQVSQEVPRPCESNRTNPGLIPGRRTPLDGSFDDIRTSGLRFWGCGRKGKILVLPGESSSRAPKKRSVYILQPPI